MAKEEEEVIRAWLQRRNARRCGRELDERMLAEGYVRFGAFCGQGRRAMWARLSKRGAVLRENMLTEDPDMIEIKLGREGDDYIVVCKPAQRLASRDLDVFAVVWGIVSSGMYHLEDAEDGQRRL